LVRAPGAVLYDVDAMSLVVNYVRVVSQLNWLQARRTRFSADILTAFRRRLKTLVFRKCTPTFQQSYNYIRESCVLKGNWLYGARFRSTHSVLGNRDTQIYGTTFPQYTACK